jgi:hypothetical protein
MLVTWTEFHDLRFVKRTKFKPWTGFHDETVCWKHFLKKIERIATLNIFYMNGYHIATLNGFQLKEFPKRWTDFPKVGYMNSFHDEQKSKHERIPTLNILKKWTDSTLNGFQLQQFPKDERIFKGWLHEQIFMINEISKHAWNFKAWIKTDFHPWTYLLHERNSTMNSFLPWTVSVSKQILKWTLSPHLETFFKKIHKMNGFHLERFLP